MIKIDNRINPLFFVFYQDLTDLRNCLENHDKTHEGSDYLRKKAKIARRIKDIVIGMVDGEYDDPISSGNRILITSRTIFDVWLIRRYR